jgi:hypothetical protein
MKKAMNLLLVGLLVGFAGTAGALSVTASDGTDTGANLVDTLRGSGITIVDESVAYTGPGAASGAFTDGLSSGLGFDEGIILTTGTAADAEGPNESDTTSTRNWGAGHSLLDDLIPNYDTFDATVLEFDFISDGGDLFFNFVFASEEYNEYVDTAFNDVFGFFVDGENVALIPGTTDAVSINNVNGGNPLGHLASNPEFYNNNDLSDGGPFYDIEYDGFTDAFTAEFLGLTPGSHHMILAIADAGDRVLDSAVFLQAGTFSDTTQTPPPVVPEPATVTMVGLGLGGLAASRRRRT